MVPMNKWGKDHWSLLAYLEVRCVDNKGTISRLHMRVNLDRHPFFAHEGTSKTKFPTKLANGEELVNHDDLDCLEDIEAAGLVRNVGTGVNPLIEMTELGCKAAAEVRAFKARGGMFAEFVFSP